MEEQKDGVFTLTDVNDMRMPFYKRFGLLTGSKVWIYIEIICHIYYIYVITVEKFTYLFLFASTANMILFMLLYSLKYVKFSIISDMPSVTGHQWKKKNFHPLLNTLYNFFSFGWLFFKEGLNVQCEKVSLRVMMCSCVFGNIRETSSELTLARARSKWMQFNNNNYIL